MLGPVPESPSDLRFPCLGIPVRVHPSFWLVGAIMGWSPGWALALGTNVLAVLLMWLACLFVSILVHEMGHALAARRFGWPPEIVLYYFGGVAMYRPTGGHTPSRSIFISFAGPLAGFCLFGLLVVFERSWLEAGRSFSPLTKYTLIQLKYINLWWGLVNLLPVLPLDGGRISEQVCMLLNRRRGLEFSIRVGILAAAGVAIFFALNKDTYGIYPVFLFGYLAFLNVQSLQAAQRGPW